LKVASNRTMVSKEVATRIDGVGSEPQGYAGQGHGVDAGKATMTDIGIRSWRYRKKEELYCQNYYYCGDHEH